MATIKSVTAGKLLQEFLKGYDEEPFGEQGLVIVKQLIDIAFPETPLNEIITSEELRNLLTNAAAMYNFRKQPLFLAFTSFILEKSSKEIKRMSGDQLKNELVTLIADDIDRPLPSLELDRSMYDLSGNPESATVVKSSLEGALISTTASLFEYLLIGSENNPGKLFHTLDTNIRVTANRLRTINPIVIILNEIVQNRWDNISINGCLPTLTELKTKDICKYVETDPEAYLNHIKSKCLRKFEFDLKTPLLSLINSSQLYAEQKNPNFQLEYEVENPLYNKIAEKIIRDLLKIQSKVQSNKKVAAKDFDSLVELLDKECLKIEKDISKEFENFQKKVEGLIYKVPPWFRYEQNDSIWELKSSEQVLKELNEQITMKKAFEYNKESKLFQKIIPIFEQLGGIHFAFENIIAHHFYDRVPFRLVKLLETPAKQQKIKILKSLQEMRYNEGIDAVRNYLVQPSEILISNLLKIGLFFFKDTYMKDNPSVSIDEEDLKNPRYIKLLEFPKDLLEEHPPELFLGEEYFIFQKGEEVINIGFHLKSYNGKGNDLFGLLVSSTAYENAQIYKQATRVLGNFSGYVYSTAIGNMKVCPPALKPVDDLFM